MTEGLALWWKLPLPKMVDYRPCDAFKPSRLQTPRRRVCGETLDGLDLPWVISSEAANVRINTCESHAAAGDTS